MGTYPKRHLSADLPRVILAGWVIALSACSGGGSGGKSGDSQTPQVNYTAPKILSATLSNDVLPLPQVGESFSLMLEVNFEDSDLDANKITVTRTRPDGESRSSDSKLAQAERYGAFVRTFDVSSEDPAGRYSIQLKLFDAQNLQSDVADLSYEISASAPRVLSINSVTPTQGRPGDVVTIAGLGFELETTTNRVTFAGAIGPADIVSGSVTELKVLVPEGAITGKIAVANTSGRVLSSDEFSIAPVIALTPQTSQVVTEGVADFHCAVSGLANGHVVWSINGQDTPPDTLGTITSNGVYTAPKAVPVPASLKVGCRAVANGALTAEADVLIVQPPAPPGQANIVAASGGIAASANDEVTLLIPADALAADTSITVAQLAPTDYPAAIVGSYNAAAAKFEPSGLTFAKPVLATFQLSNWLEPGSVLPLFIVNEISGKLEDSGATATVNDSGMTATGAISHFSTFVAAVQRAAAQPTLAEQTGAFVSESAFFDFYRIVRPAGIEWLEGLTVPILVNKNVGTQNGVGPFTSGIQVSAEFTDPTLKSHYRIAVGPYVQPSADGWQLVTVVHLPVVEACNEGETANARLLIGYPQQGVMQTLAIGFNVKCLNELFVLGDQTITLSNRGSVNYFSKLHVYLGGALRIDVQSNNPAPVRIWVTNDVRIDGELGMNGTPGESALYDGGRGGRHYAGDGGAGGPYSIASTCYILSGINLVEYPCTKTIGDGIAGKPSLNGASGGAGGKHWEEGTEEDLVLSIFVGLLSLLDGDYIGAIRGLVEAADEYVLILNNETARYKSAGYGGGRGTALIYAPEDLSTFAVPQGGGGGGGGGQMDDDRQGAGGGGGGGGAPVLELVSGGNVWLTKLCLAPGVCTHARINGTGGNGGVGGSRYDFKTGPGGGGGGGSGGQVVIVANRLLSEGEIDLKGGIGGVSGQVLGEEDNYHEYFVESGFGKHGENGKIRLNGLFEGNAPINAMKFHIGPRLGPLLAIGTIDSDQWCKSVDLGGMYGFPQLVVGFSRHYNYYRIVNGVAQTTDPEFVFTNTNNTYGTTPLCFPLTPGLNSLSLKVGYDWNLSGTARPLIELNPWEQQHVVYFPGLRDTDHDGLADGLEAKIGTNPNLPDTDGDGLSDAQEVARNTNPLVQDTDGDYFTDGEEVAAGTNPLDPNSHPSGDRVPPAVAATNPPNTADGALLVGPITASFSEPLDGATVNATSFVVTGPAGAVAGTVSLSGDGLVASFVPQAALAFATDYQVQLATSIHDLAGNSLPGAVTWQFNTGKQLATGQSHTCARLVDGGLKCWGQGTYGVLGLGDIVTRGDAAGEMGNALPRVDLGSGRKVVQVVAAYSHTCARLDDDTVKCWGLNSSGVLGLGDIYNRGDSIGEMGDNLPAVNLGANRRVVQLAAGDTHNCARFTDGAVKCWGANSWGSLGLGDANARGDEANEMGDNLPTVDLGSGRSAVAIAAGGLYNCAVLDDRSLKCWGRNHFGQLGVGDSEHRGDTLGEMGNALPKVNLGVGRAAIEIATGGMNTCVVLDDHTVKCWGYNNTGQLGLGDTYARSVPVTTVDLGEGRSAVDVIAATQSACARLDDSSLKCWGGNTSGQLGLGDVIARGRFPEEMGDALPPIDLGTGRLASEVDMNTSHACARLDNGDVKCWGNNAAGQLGLGDTANRGDAPGEMGDALPTVEIGN